MAHRHVLICGEVGAGKSTLIRRLIAESGLPVYGFFTKKLDEDRQGFHPIYLHPASQPAQTWAWTEEYLVGWCNRKSRKIYPDVFNIRGVGYLQSARPGGVIVMDELGFMETEAEPFMQAVFSALDSDIPVLAAVKARFDIPFLNAVRQHPNGQVYTITPDNRESLFQSLLPTVRAWNPLGGAVAASL